MLSRAIFAFVVAVALWQAAPTLAQAPTGPLAALALAWPGATSEQLVFMRAVYQRQFERTGRAPIDDLPASALAPVAPGFQLAKPAAGAARQLLAALRKAPLEWQVEIVSAYRPPSRQFRNWQQNFPRYYEQTATAREALEGGAHGEAAIDYLAAYIGRRLAPPGFSPHNLGIALDFGAEPIRRPGTERRSDPVAVPLTVNTERKNIEVWRKSSLYAWLVANASKYDFHENTQIEEPWHWEYRPPSQ